MNNLVVEGLVKGSSEGDVLATGPDDNKSLRVCSVKEPWVTIDQFELTSWLA